MPRCANCWQECRNRSETELLFIFIQGRIASDGGERIRGGWGGRCEKAVETMQKPG
jgi:hypothetical protein